MIAPCKLDMLAQTARARPYGWWTSRPFPRLTTAQIALCWKRREIASGYMSVVPAGPPHEPGSIEVIVQNAEGEVVWLEIMEPEPTFAWCYDTGAVRS